MAANCEIQSAGFFINVSCSDLTAWWRLFWNGDLWTQLKTYWVELIFKEKLICSRKEK